MEWPVLVDSLNLLEVTAVPITLLIDEYGIVRAVRPQPEDLESFLDASYEPTREAHGSNRYPTPDLAQMGEEAQSGTAEDLRRLADALVLWGDSDRLTEAIKIYQDVLKVEPEDALTHFRLGVAFRKRYDSSHEKPGDFASAVGHWKTALDIDPNQYIWRRRIQQYGPRLDKPYPFYDWVHQAREEIQNRGEEPVSLSVEPGGAEFAAPVEQFSSSRDTEEPDPDGRIYRDDGLIEIETVVVPHTDRSSSAMGHVIFRPNEGRKAHWNNEVEDLKVWVDPPEGWSVERRLYRYPNPPSAVTQEERQIEIELNGPEDFSESVTIPGYSLYFVCEDVNGTCLYRRQDFSIVYEGD